MILGCCIAQQPFFLGGLFMQMFHMTLPGHPEATLDGYILDCDLSFGQYALRPAIVVCPGGGYVYCSRAEGEPVAMAYAARGFHTFVLRYSTGHDAAGFAPLQEVSWVIGYIRENAEKWHIDPEKIVTCGFSAGGHLALSAGILGENKPNAMILGYPATSAPNMPGANFMLKLLEGKIQVTNEDAAKYDLPSQVTKEAPPMFVAATCEDALTGFCTMALVNAYNALGLKFELHIFQHGPHGYSLANETTSDGSTRYMNAAFSQWHGLSVEWLHKIFGPLTYVDKDNSKMMKYLKELGISLDA